MNFIGLRYKYDQVLTNSIFFLKNENERNLSDIEEKLVQEYFKNAKLFFSKTLALYDDETYIAPYMLFSDGEWIWPSYLPYFVNKEKAISEPFFAHMQKNDFQILPLSKDKIFEITSLVEKEFINFKHK